MKTRALLAFCLAAACNTAPPEFLPPPFGPGEPTNARFFFPTGMAVLPDGSLLVANGNFNHAYDAGTVLSVRKAYLDAFFAQKLSCDTPTPVPACDDDVSRHPGDVFGGAVMIGNYAGPLTLDDTGTRAFTGSRDSNRLNAVQINPDLTLACAPNAGKTPDCRAGAIDLTASGVLGPYSIAAGDYIAAGGPPQRVLYVSSVTPRIDAVAGQNLATSSLVAALDMADPSRVLFTMLASSPFVANGTGVGPMLFDPVRRQLVMSGCYERFSGGGAGEPGTSRCGSINTNYLRFLDVDAGTGALVQLVDLFGEVFSIDTTALLFADRDPVTQAPGTLWVTMRNPDLLAQVELSAFRSIAPRVRRVVPLPISPSDLVRIPRAGKADLIAVVAERAGSVVFYDAGQQQVVSEIEHLGDSPFTLQLLSSDGVTARLAASVFRSCGNALIEVPLEAPWNAALRGRAGRCP